MTMRAKCETDGPCDFHRDGGAAVDKCPWYCDVEGCQEQAIIEVAPEVQMCRQDAARALGAS